MTGQKAENRRHVSGSAEALLEGIRRVNRAPVIAVSVFVVTLLMAVPFTAIMREAISRHLGNSLAAEQAARGVNAQWWTEFTAQAGPLGRTFQPGIIGFAAVLDNISTLADGEWRPSPILWLGAAYLLMWLFLSGGILDRYARGRPTRSYEFFSASGVYFVRFLRLAPFMALAYYALFAMLHPLLFDEIYEELTRNVTVERTAFLVRVALYLMFGVVLALVNLVFDYAKVRAVVEDRRSMIGAILASMRFIRRNFGSVVVLYLLNGLLLVGILLLYALLAPGAGWTGAGLLVAIAIGQLYVLARVWVRLLFLASETALFQRRLAHAGYVARAPARASATARRRATSRTSRQHAIEPVIGKILDIFVILLVAVLFLVAGTGGIDAELGSLRIRAQDWTRPFMLLVVVLAARAWASARTSAPGFSKDTIAHYVATRGLTALLIAIGCSYVPHHVRIAGGLDSYGYVSTAALIATGRLSEPQPLADVLPFENPLSAATPLGYVPDAEGTVSVPRFPIGLPLVMAFFSLAGPAGPFFVPLVMAYGVIALVYLLGRSLSGGCDPHICGLFAAAVVAAEPLFVAYAIQPMSDVPATCWLLAAVWYAVGERAPARTALTGIAAGLCGGMALLTRTALGLAVNVLVAVIDARSHLRFFRAFGATVLAFIMVQIALNVALYGSPTASGYGPASHVLELSRLGANLWNFGKWLTYSHTALVWLIWPAAMFVLRRQRWAWQLSCVAAAATVPYLFHVVFDDWESPRFLLPAIVLVLILSALALAQTLFSVKRFARAAGPLLLALAILLAAGSNRFLEREGIYGLATLEAKYALVGDWFRKNTSERVVVLAALHSGTIRFYGDRQTVRWDHIPGNALTATVRNLIAAGYEPYLVLDLPSEPPLFDKRFSSQPMNAQQVARVRVVNIYKFMSAY